MHNSSILWLKEYKLQITFFIGPREREQSENLQNLQNELSIELSTDLRQMSEHERTWLSTIEKYFDKHENLLLEAVSAGFGEGGGGSIWTYPGCILFAVSLLTTLGLFNM